MYEKEGVSGIRGLSNAQCLLVHGATRAALPGEESRQHLKHRIQLLANSCAYSGAMMRSALPQTISEGAAMLSALSHTINVRRRRDYQNRS
jgi:hypothetical protein